MFDDHDSTQRVTFDFGSHLVDCGMSLDEVAATSLHGGDYIEHDGSGTVTIDFPAEAWVDEHDVHLSYHGPDGIDDRVWYAEFVIGPDRPVNVKHRVDVFEDGGSCRP